MSSTDRRPANHSSSDTAELAGFFTPVEFCSSSANTLLTHCAEPRNSLMGNSQTPISANEGQAWMMRNQAVGSATVLGLLGLGSMATAVFALRWYLRRARNAYLAEGAANSGLAETMTSTATGARTVEARTAEPPLRAPDPGKR